MEVPYSLLHTLPQVMLRACMLHQAALGKKRTVRYPVQPWNWIWVKPAAISIPRSDRSQIAPATQSDQAPIPQKVLRRDVFLREDIRRNAGDRRGRSIRNISVMTFGLSTQRLKTPFVIITSMDTVGTGKASARLKLVMEVIWS